MGFTFDIDMQTGQARIVADGEADVDAAIETLALLATHADFRPGLRLLVDLRRLTTPRKGGDIDQIAAYVRRNLALSRIAIVSADPVAASVQHRLREHLEGEVPAGVFTDATAAGAWLGQRG